MKNDGFAPALVGGALAGFTVDISLFPLDTIKTRLQSPKGFWKSGGFKGVYKGIGPVALGSAPGAAIFFVSYDTTKRILSRSQTLAQSQTLTYMVAACTGEVMACLVRVPVEVVKQRSQTISHVSSFKILKKTIKSESLLGLFRGYSSTVLREIPFSVIQFPLWEYLKHRIGVYQDSPVSPLQGAFCGMVSGGISAALTTPLDVAKTRIMLANRKEIAATGRIFPVLKGVYKTQGVRGLFAGVVPRVLWISVGGFIFLGTYDLVSSVIK